MKEEKLEVLKTNTIFATDLVNKGSIMLTAWRNGEGFEINLFRNGGYQTISICYSEFDLLKKMVKKLSKTPISG